MRPTERNTAESNPREVDREEVKALGKLIRYAKSCDHHS